MKEIDYRIEGDMESVAVMGIAFLDLVSKFRENVEKYGEIPGLNNPFIFTIIDDNGIGTEVGIYADNECVVMKGKGIKNPSKNDNDVMFA